MPLFMHDVEKTIESVKHVLDPSSQRYGRLLNWQNPNDPFWHYGIGLSDTHIFDTGQGLCPFERKDAKFVIGIEDIAFEPEQTIDRLQQALYVFYSWEYTFTGWNREHLGRLIATDQPRCYQSSFLWWMCDMSPEGDHKTAQQIFQNHLSAVNSSLTMRSTKDQGTERLDLNLKIKPIVNGLFHATLTHRGSEVTAIGSTKDEAAEKALERLRGEVNPVDNQKSDIQDAAVSIGVGTAVGAGTSAAVGGMGLLVAGSGVSIGMAPVAAVGAVVGTAVYGAKKAIEDQDATALGAAALGAGAGMGVSAVVGGMGLAVAGTAVGVGMAPVAVVGAVLGLAGYGIFKLFGGGDEQS